MTENTAGLPMSPLEILALLGALALVAARWLPPAARARATIAAVAVLVPCAVALGVTGIRWQLLPVLAGAALALPFALFPLLRPLRRRPGRRGGPAGGWRCRPRRPAPG